MNYMNYKAKDFNLKYLCRSVQSGSWHAVHERLGDLVLFRTKQGQYHSEWSIFKTGEGLKNPLYKGRTLGDLLNYLKHERVQPEMKGRINPEYCAGKYGLEDVRQFGAGDWGVRSEPLGSFTIQKVKEMFGAIGYSPDRCWFLRHEKDLNLSCEAGTLHECLEKVQEFEKLHYKRYPKIDPIMHREQDEFDRWIIKIGQAECEVCLDKDTKAMEHPCVGCRFNDGKTNFRVIEKQRFKPGTGQC